MINLSGKAVTSGNITVDKLAEAMVRLSLPETEKIIRSASLKIIESNEDRHDVANRLANISRQLQHQHKDVVSQISKQMGGLDRVLTNCMVFMNRAMLRWQRESPLDAYVRKALVSRRFILAALLLDQPEFVLDSEHPVNQLLIAIEKLFMGWVEMQGQPPMFVSKALAALTRLLDADHCLIYEEQVLARDSLYKAWEKESRRRENLEKRLIQTEIGLDNANYAQNYAKTSIFNAVRGNPLPAPVIQILEGVWLDILRKTLLEGGTKDRQFIKLQEITIKMVFCYRGNHSSKQKQLLFNYAGQLVGEVSNQINKLGFMTEPNGRLLEQMHELMLAILKGSDIDRLVYKPDLPENEVPQTDADLTGLTGYEGLWFKRFGKIWKFLQVLPNYQNILWSDFNGRKAAIEPCQQFLTDLAENRVKQFSEEMRIQGIFYDVASEFVTLDKQARQEHQRKLQKQKELRKAAQEKAEAEARAILQAKEDAARKLEQERKEIEEKLHREALEAEERKNLLQKKAARNEIDCLPVGGWVMLNKADKKVKCKLGVRLNATGRLIFVDSFGMKMAEMMRDEAVQQLLENKLEILGEGADFEDRLSRVVGRIGIAKR